MNIILDLADYLHSITGISIENARHSVISAIIVIVILFVKWIIKLLYSKSSIDDRTKFSHNRKIQITLSVTLVVILVLIWNEKLGGLLTVVSFISAGFAIAMRDVIVNFFAGIYIGVTKPFVIEDRIEINDVKGDIINMKALGFEVLEVGERVHGEQSSGRIVHLPNSLIFSSPLKNYVKVFKYIWNEIKIDIELDSDVEKTKAILYDIVENNEVLKTIPRKMEDAVDEASVEYRIYFNNLDPIIYTSIKDNHISLDIRYLVHPKKARNVENEIYSKILEEYRQGNIKLYKS